MNTQDLMDAAIPTQEPYMLPVREDRTGPDAKGFQRSEGCGCLMTQVCFAFSLPITAQDAYTFRYYTVEQARERASEPVPPEGLKDALALYDKLQPYGAPTEWPKFWELVRDVQSYQDSAWNEFLGWLVDGPPEDSDYFDENGYWIPEMGYPKEIDESRRGYYRDALRALRLLGVEVKWIEGSDTPPPNHDYTWLRQVPGYCPVGGAV